MNGAASWLTVGLLAVGAVGILLLSLLSARVTWRFPWSGLDITCPKTGQRLTVTAVYDLERAQWVNVARCSEKGFPACGRECLHPKTPLQS